MLNTTNNGQLAKWTFNQHFVIFPTYDRYQMRSGQQSKLRLSILPWDTNTLTVTGSNLQHPWCSNYGSCTFPLETHALKSKSCKTSFLFGLFSLSETHITLELLKYSIPTTVWSAVNCIIFSLNHTIFVYSCHQCWETYVGMEIYKLVLLDFIVQSLATFFLEFIRR